MERITRPISKSDLPVIEHEGILESKLPVIRSKHASKHMSFNTGEHGRSEVIEREDGIGYNPKTGTFYQTQNFGK